MEFAICTCQADTIFGDINGEGTGVRYNVQEYVEKLLYLILKYFYAHNPWPGRGPDPESTADFSVSRREGTSI